MNHCRLHCWLVAASIALCGTAQAAPLAYAVSSDDGDVLYELDLATGSARHIGIVDAPYLDVEGLALSSTGELFGIDDATKTLITLDVNTAAVNVLRNVRGNTGLPSGINNAFDPAITFTCDGRLLMSSTRSKLYELDAVSAVANPIGGNGNTMTENITDIAAQRNTLYGLGHTALHRIDPLNGTSTLIGTYGGGINFAEGGGLAFDQAGNLWAIADRSVSSSPSQIYRIDVNTGRATAVVNTPIRGIESLVITTTQCGPALAGVPIIPVPGLAHSALGALLLLMASLGLLHLRR